jgi:hypothetical protein
MAYSSTGPLILVSEGISTDAPRTFAYSSTHTSTEVTGTGFLTGVGAGSRGLNGLGLRVGDLVMCRASTGSATPGGVSWHSCISSTADNASTSASSGWNSAFNCTLSAAL